MRRLLRWAFNGAVVLSVVLFVTTCVLWVRSYIASDGIRWWRSPKIRMVCTVNGGIRVRAIAVQPEDCPMNMVTVFRGEAARAPYESDERFFSPTYDYKLGGFALEYGYGLGISEYKSATAPFWFIAPLLMLLPAVRLREILRQDSRQSTGLCPSCGYDLRATTDRCPECGAVPTGRSD